MQLTTRPAIPDDKGFFFQLYAGTREQELAAFGWSDQQKQAFLQMQFNAQQRWYEAAYPQAEWRIVMLEGKPVGRTIVERGQAGATLVDIALMPESRGAGLGTRLIEELLEHCRAEGIPVRLQVLKTNPAQRLYQRLGFRTVGEDQLYLQMEWRPGDTQPAN
jgi:ribosomal protein S18 acetylase RimI-like enzyme